MLSVSEPKPSLLKISDKLSVRFQKIGSGPPLLLLHTVRTQLEYFRSLAPLLATSHTVYALDLPGHGHSPIDLSANFDEPYFRQAVIRFIEELNLTDVTIVGESIGGALALTVAASLPQRVKRVYAINPYDYEARYGDGIRRGNWLANFIIGSLQIPLIGAVNASLENKMILGKIMGGGYHDSRKLPADLLAEFDEVAGSRARCWRAGDPGARHATTIGRSRRRSRSFMVTATGLGQTSANARGRSSLPSRW
jgi:pimeloyl-ACP methyl ester carboxylesterase